MSRDPVSMGLLALIILVISWVWIYISVRLISYAIAKSWGRVTRVVRVSKRKVKGVKNEGK